MINVRFRTINGENPIVALEDNFTWHGFCALIEKHLGKTALKDWVFICKGKQLQISNEELFMEQRAVITDNCIIQVCRRSASGSTYESESVFAEKFLNAVSCALDCAPKTNDVTCSICLTNNTTCIQFSCSSCSRANVLCNSCLMQYLKISYLRFKCLHCPESIEILNIFSNAPSLRTAVDTFKEMQELKLNIDCQICRCGEAKVNTTMYSQQYCEECQRWYCFFCNETWSTAMTNQQYTCGINCYYQNKITYEMMPFTYGDRPGMTQIPNCRSCPNRNCLELCARIEGYGPGCPMHICESCGHSFCFICLRPETECANNFNSCNVIKQQTYQDFPKSTDI